jgi:hypothetical protein
MLATPWFSRAPAQPGCSYLALVSFLPLRHFRAIPQFFKYTFETQRQLRTAAGLIGYSLEAQLFRRKFWTLSVWLDQRSLQDFVGTIPHSHIMQALAGHMGRSRFEQWTVQSNEIPLDWNAAKARISYPGGPAL